MTGEWRKLHEFNVRYPKRISPVNHRGCWSCIQLLFFSVSEPPRDAVCLSCLPRRFLIYLCFQSETAAERHRLLSVAPVSGDWCLSRSASYPVGMRTLDVPLSNAVVATDMRGMPVVVLGHYVDYSSHVCL